MTYSVTTSGPFAFDPETVSPSGEATVDITDFVREKQALARAAGYREALAVMAAWHKAEEQAFLADYDRLGKKGAEGPATSVRVLTAADIHARSARRAKALAAAADDPAGPLPLRVRHRRDGGIVTARVSTGPEHGGAFLGSLFIPAAEFDGVRAGWPGAAFVEETPRGTD